MEQNQSPGKTFTWLVGDEKGFLCAPRKSTIYALLASICPVCSWAVLDEVGWSNATELSAVPHLCQPACPSW